MSEVDVDVRPASVFERHLQTVLAVVVTGLIAWMGNTVSENSNQLVRLEERLVAMADKLDGFNGMRVTVSSLEIRVAQLEREMERRNDR